MRNAKQQHTLSYSAALSIMRILELESRCAVQPHRGFEPHTSARSSSLSLSPIQSLTFC